jgi:very-short-patch-repair endonuclease
MVRAGLPTRGAHECCGENRPRRKPGLWGQLRAHRFFRAKFHRQFPIGDFIADFCCREKRLAIDLDGGRDLDRPRPTRDVLR